MIMLLLAELARRVNALPYKPPVTLALMAANVAVYLGLVHHPMLASVERGCLKPSLIAERGQLGRLLTSGFIHGHDYHLYYNMLSLLYKGASLERAHGSGFMAALSAFALIAAHSAYVAAAWLARDALPGTYYGCAVGFSGVLFALKTVWNARSEPSVWKYAAWSELVLASLISPQASFLGHLCGIVAGLLWLQLERAHRLHRRGRQLWQRFTQFINAPLNTAPSPRTFHPPRPVGAGVGVDGGGGGVGGISGAESEDAALAWRLQQEELRAARLRRFQR